METNSVEVRKTITISGTFDSGVTQTFNSYINVEFIPDELIVRNGFIVTEDGGPMFLVLSSICPGFSIPMQDSKLGSFTTNPISSPIYYKVTNPINGIYTFQLQDVEGGTTDRGALYYSFVFEFVRYKRIESQKIY